MVDIKERSLGTFEKHILTLFHKFVHEYDRVSYKGLKILCVLHVFVIDFLDADLLCLIFVRE